MEKPQIALAYHSGLANLIDALVELARDKIKQLPANDLERLQSCCSDAQMALNGIQFMAALSIDKVDRDDQEANKLSYCLHDFIATNAEVSTLLFVLYEYMNSYQQQGAKQ